MHAVVTRSTLHDYEPATSFLIEQVIPRLRQAPGFVGGQWVRLDDTTGISMLTFETEEAARAWVEEIEVTPVREDITRHIIEVGEVVERI